MRRRWARRAMVGRHDRIGFRLRVGTLAAGAVLVSLGGCGSATVSGPRGAASADSGSASAGSVVSASVASVGAMPSPSDSSSAQPCRSGVITIAYQQGDPFAGSLCVRVGAEISITLGGPDSYRWSAVISSNEAVAAVVSTEGGVTGRATVRVLAAGDVVLRATTSFAADPYGPPTRLWQQALHIEP